VSSCTNRHVGHVARRLQLLVERDNRLRRDRRAQRRQLAAALAALQAIDARPLAHVVAVGGAAFEHLFLQPLENRLLDAVALAVRVRGAEADVEPGASEQTFFDADDHRQVKHRIVRRDADLGQLCHCDFLSLRMASRIHRLVQKLI